MTRGLLVIMLCGTWMAVFGAPVSAQTVLPFDKIQNQEELNRVGAALDAELFDSYNKCDLAKFESFFVDDVEFYHDQAG